jgi:hypothetical protein
MLRFALAVALGIGAVTLAGSTFTVNADEKKEKDAKDVKKLEGKLTCTKCTLAETKACGHALVLKEDGKEVKYYLVDKGGKESYHGKCCQEPVDAIVTGKVVEKDKKKMIEEPKVEIKK